jgi:restriction system protein
MSKMTPTFGVEWRQCGKKVYCRTCQAGDRHGPYNYAYWRENGNRDSIYCGKVVENRTPYEQFVEALARREMREIEEIRRASSAKAPRLAAQALKPPKKGKPNETLRLPLETDDQVTKVPAVPATTESQLVEFPIHESIKRLPQVSEDLAPRHGSFTAGVAIPVPNFQLLMLPLLQKLGDGNSHDYGKVREYVAAVLKLDDAILAERTPSGKQGVFNNRLTWAKTHLSKAGALTAPDRKTLRITARGLALLAETPSAVTAQMLGRFPEYCEFVGDGAGDVKCPNIPVATGTPAAVPVLVESDPRTVFEDSYRRINEQLQDEMLERLKTVSPGFFERLVVDAVLAMGYGGFRKEAGRVTRFSGDGGIDGVIYVDRLGLDRICLQAKRYADKTVGRRDVQEFVGSLHVERARKGVFITTSTFSLGAREYVERIDANVALIDGRRLAKLMIEYYVGVNKEAEFVLRRVDGDYFEEA